MAEIEGILRGSKWQSGYMRANRDFLRLNADHSRCRLICQAEGQIFESSAHSPENNCAPLSGQEDAA